MSHMHRDRDERRSDVGRTLRMNSFLNEECISNVLLSSVKRFIYDLLGVDHNQSS